MHPGSESGGSSSACSGVVEDGLVTPAMIEEQIERGKHVRADAFAAMERAPRTDRILESCPPRPESRARVARRNAAHGPSATPIRPAVSV
ncbi:MAG: hypothetical protein R3E53_05670 [Myxococcota bacterium]